MILRGDVDRIARRTARPARRLVPLCFSLRPEEEEGPLRRLEDSVQLGG